MEAPEDERAGRRELVWLGVPLLFALFRPIGFYASNVDQVTFGDLARPFTSRRFDRALLAGPGVARESVDGREIASVGRPVPGVSIRIVGKEGREVGEGAVGDVDPRRAAGLLLAVDLRNVGAAREPLLRLVALDLEEGEGRDVARGGVLLDLLGHDHGRQERLPRAGRAFVPRHISIRRARLVPGAG